MDIIPVNDGYETNPIVATAVAMLYEFAASYGEAAALLPRWRWYSELTERERTAVLARFPRSCGDVESDGYDLATGGGQYTDDSNSGPGWPLNGDVR